MLDHNAVLDRVEEALKEAAVQAASRERDIPALPPPAEARPLGRRRQFGQEREAAINRAEQAVRALEAELTDSEQRLRAWLERLAAARAHSVS